MRQQIPGSPPANRVRRLVPEDAEVAATVIALLKTDARPPRVTADALRRFLESEANILLAAFKRDRPVGYLVGYRLDRVDSGLRMLLIYEVCVEEASRRQGFGSELVRRALDLESAETTHKTWVLTASGNQAARRLYESLGARRAGAHELYVWEGDAAVGPFSREP